MPITNDEARCPSCKDRDVWQNDRIAITELTVSRGHTCNNCNLNYDVVYELTYAHTSYSEE